MSSQNDEGFIPITEILQMHEMRKICKEFSEAKVKSALKKAKNVVFNADFTMVRRKLDAFFNASKVEEAGVMHYQKSLKRIVQFYFGDINYPVHKKLRALAEAMEGNWIPVAKFMEFSRINRFLRRLLKERNITITPEQLIDTVKNSNVVEGM